MVVNDAAFFLSHREPVAKAARDHGFLVVVATAAGLGLLATDDIDALDVLVPEPGTLALLGLGGLLAAVWAWRKRKRIAVGS